MNLTPFTKMNPEIKYKWTHALRSGKYKQGRSRLNWFENSEKSFCCLGVLCDVFIKSTGKGTWVPDGRLQGFNIAVDDDIDACTPVNVIRDWAGLDKDISNNGVINTLMGLNDDYKMSFNEIADWIEENL